VPVSKERQDTSKEPVVEARPTQSKLIDVESQDMRVARLRANEPLSQLSPSEYCLDDGKIWKGASYRLGGVNVFGLDHQLVAFDAPQLVAVVGPTKIGLDSKLQLVGPCPKGYEPIHAQMRSDWVAPEGGPISTHEKLKSLPYQEGVRAMKVEMVEFLENDEDVVRFRMTNPFSLPLAGLKFDAQYEGGGGKPMPTLVEQVLTLQPGASTELELPRVIDSAAPRSKAGSGLHTLNLSGRLGRAELDIEIFVPH
jgi:hypothetical protein